jgi:murein DD-endopeptidase MepM/ murein hydrolase activator NlpD
MRTGWILVLALASCSVSNRGGLFAPKSPHKQYEEKITGAGLHQSVMGRSWIDAAARGLSAASTIQLPYAETGYFEADHPASAGYAFNVRRGEKLVVTVSRKPVTGFTLFAELWQQQANGPKYIASADTGSNTLEYEIKEEGRYLVRIQPELLASGEYSIRITTAASLAFPVSNTKARVGSFWGDARDAGARSHEGVDIFGSFRTPVVAAADGFVHFVTVNELGGKVVFMRPAGKEYSLYYAHLDSQTVSSGQRVSSGDVLGLMGNTGNARNTATHLHFGIYTNAGAVDPLPFIQQNRPEPAPISAPLAGLNTLIRTDKNTSLYTFPGADASQREQVPSHTLLQVIAATGSYYKVRLPDGTESFIPHTHTDPAQGSFRSVTLTDNTPLFDKPDSSAARKTVLTKGEKIKVNARFDKYYYVIRDSASGWIAVSAGK